MDTVANGGVTRGAYLEGRDEEILYRRMRDDMIQKREEGMYPSRSDYSGSQITDGHVIMLIANPLRIALEDAKAGIVRTQKKRTFFKRLFGCGYQDEGRIVPYRKRDEGEKDGVVR